MSKINGANSTEINGANGGASEQARAMLYTGKSKQGHTLSVYSTPPYVEIDGKVCNTSVNFRYASKSEDGKVYTMKRYNSCQVNIDGKTNSWGEGKLDEQTQQALLKHYEQANGKPLSNYGVWVEKDGERASTSKSRVKLYDSTDELLNGTGLDEYMLPLAVLLRRRAEMRSEQEQSKSAVLATLKKTASDLQEQANKALAEYDKVCKEWQEVHGLTEQEWQDEQEQALKKQNAYLLEKFPSLASKSDLLAKSQEQEQALAESKQTNSALVAMLLSMGKTMEEIEQALAEIKAK